ncbi:MAG: rhodanese-like domain-containing protein [Phycisphaerae bacterium]
MAVIDPHWEVSVQEVQAMLTGTTEILLLDVRQPDEHERGRIEGACLLPLSELERRLDELRGLAAGHDVIAYCHHGSRSLQAVSILRRAGFEQVRSMAGGLDAWSVYVDASVPRY